MNLILKKIETALRKIALLVLLIIALGLSVVTANAQSGTYVTPRITPVFNGWVTNAGTYTNSFVITNWLNASGWHNVNLLLSESGTNNIGTNVVTVTLYGSPGNGSGYTNAATGTNYVFTANPLLTWPNAVTATTVYSGAWTNLTQSLGDSWLWYRGTVSVVCTNTGTPLGGFYLQLDAVVTP